MINWMPAARLVRAQAVSLKEKEFVEAARGSGASDGRIMSQHLLPNVVPIIVVTATIGIPQAIIYEAGHQLPRPWRASPHAELGSDDLGSDPQSPLLSLYARLPRLAFSITVLAFNFLGDGLRDALDPWMER